MSGHETFHEPVEDAALDVEPFKGNAVLPGIGEQP